jgi:hypothetical protein
MSQSASAEEIRDQMAQVRRELNLNYGEVVENARDLTDWRYYVRNYPWATLGAAVAIGYLVVPNRIQMITPDANELLKLARKQKLVVEPKPQAEPKSTVGGQVFNMLANMLTRGLISYAGQKFGKTAGRKTAQAQESSQGPYPFPR